MRERNPEAKRRQLLDAALVEFAARGRAGTPVDAIARRAGCSPGLIYTYFDSKEGLFDAVMADISADIIASVPLDTDDLAGYAVRLHDASEARPDMNRFVAWYQLEREPDQASLDAFANGMGAKIAEVERAQRAGRLPAHMSAGELILAAQTIAQMWVRGPAELQAVVDRDEDAARRRNAVYEAVSALLRPPPEQR